MLRRLLVFASFLAAACAGNAYEEDDIASQEAAASALAAFPSIDAALFRLTSNESNSVYASRIAGIERDVRTASLDAVVAPGGIRARSLCHDTFLSPSLGTPIGFCFADGEDDDGNVWVNQGVTGSGDASASGTFLGRRIVAVSWHSGKQHPLGNNALARITFVDLGSLVYRHVMLVEPTSDTTFRAVASHADGLLWYGSKLLLAQGGYIRVFDLRHLWEMETGGPESAFGRGDDGKYRAGGAAFALPQVGWFRHPDTWTCTPTEGHASCFNAIALDRSGGRDTFVTAEYTVRRAGGRVIRWPIDPSTELPAIATDGLVHAIEAFSSPVWGTQGVVVKDGKFAFTGVCPEYATITDRDMPSCLHSGKGGERTRVLSKLPRNSQNLSYWRPTNELWITSEQLRERVTFQIPFPPH